jgi:hypothetical protein
MMNIKNNNIYYMYMPNRWIEFVKNWSKENKVSYGCALTKPEMKAEYHYRYPKFKTKGVAKLEESKPPEDVKSKVTYPNLKIKIPEEQENIQFEMEEMGAEEQAKPKRGRPQKYMTAEEQYKAKLESNKQKRREKAAAKKLQGTGAGTSKIAPENEAIIQKQLHKRKMIGKAADLSILTDKGKLGALEWKQLYNELTPAQKEEYRKIRDSKKVRGGMISESDSQDAEHRGQIVHKGANIKNLLKETGDAKEIQNEQYELAAKAFLHLKALKKPNSQETAIMNAGKSGGLGGIFMESIMDLPSYYRNNNIPTIEPRYK